MPIRALVGLAAALAVAGMAAAQTAVFRSLPENAKLGHLSFVRMNVVSLDGVRLKLAPGAQIRSASNLIVLPVALPQNSLVKYQLDRSGDLFRAWILTAEEAGRLDPSSTSLERGRPIEEVLPQYEPPPRIGLPPREQPASAPPPGSSGETNP